MEVMSICGLDLSGRPAGCRAALATDCRKRQGMSWSHHQSHDPRDDECWLHTRRLSNLNQF